MLDPMPHIRFRGKLISELTHEETRDALVQALSEVARLQGRSEPAIVQWAREPTAEQARRWEGVRDIRAGPLPAELCFGRDSVS